MFTITMETPGSALWAGPWGAGQARGWPVPTTPTRCAHAVLRDALLLSVCPAPVRPCAPAPGGTRSPRSPRPKPASGCPRDRGSVSPRNPTLCRRTQYYFHHRTGKTQRLGRGEAFAAGVRGRGCRSAIVLLPELSPGLVSPIGAGPEPTHRTVHQREQRVVGKPGSADECVC